jgi:hypothetical protein
MAEIHKNNLPKGLVDSMRKFLETSKPIITEDERVRNERAQALIDKRTGKSPTVLTEASDPAKAGRIAAGYKGSSPADQGSIAASKEGTPFSGGHDATNKDGHKVARKLARTAKKKEMAPEKETGVDADRENAAKNDPKKAKSMGLREVSNALLKRYLKKAPDSADYHDNITGLDSTAATMSDKDERHHWHKADQRMKGINRAKEKLKEEPEVNESKKRPTGPASETPSKEKPHVAKFVRYPAHGADDGDEWTQTYETKAKAKAHVKMFNHHNSPQMSGRYHGKTAVNEAEEKKESTGVKVGDRVWIKKEHLEKQKAPGHLAHKNFEVFHVHGDGHVNIKHIGMKPRFGSHGPYTVPPTALTKESPHNKPAKKD